MIYWRFENQEKNRYYRLLLAKDMFGDWVITKVWGGINKATGRVTHLPCATLESALLHIQRILNQRLKRGYVLVEEKEYNNNIAIKKEGWVPCKKKDLLFH